MPRRGDTETNYDVRSYDASMTREEYDRLPKHPLYIVLDNLRSAFNVGSIFRTCDILRVAGLFLCGYTASPPHRKLEKTSLGCVDFVPWMRFDRTVEAVEYLRERGTAVYAAETTSISTPFNRLIYPSPVALVLGNEALGVSRDILDRSDGIVEIPTYGFKNSLNVAAACAVLGFSVLQSWEQKNRRPSGG